VTIRACRAKLLAICFISFVAATLTPLAAQEQAPLPKHVLSANPFGLLLSFFNVEYEHAISGSTTVGVGGSTIRFDNDRYTNADAFWRFYTSRTASPLNGFAFGVKGGITKVDGRAYFGYGFDMNRSWVLGKQNNFYVGIGFGLKRLVGSDEGFRIYIPTFRIVNVGIAF
jgi:hypothetical protein